MGKLITTEEMLSMLSVQIRLTSYSAIDVVNHLALHSENHSVVMTDIAGRLGELADTVRSLKESYSPSSTSE